jgi:hypothetical protein
LADLPSVDNEAIRTLRNDIRDLGDQIDSYKARTAGAIGAGVFLLLLALGGAHDLVSHNTSISSAIGITQAGFKWIVIAFGGGGAMLMLLGLFRQWRRDRERELQLASMQRELARLEDEAADFE